MFWLFSQILMNLRVSLSKLKNLNKIQVLSQKQAELKKI